MSSVSVGQIKEPSQDKISSSEQDKVLADSPAIVHNEPIDVEPLIRSFNTWALKREHPCDPAMLERFVAHRASRGEPISFILYWGKGPRSECAPPDIKCMDFLVTLSKRISGVYAPGAEITLCLTDTHARHNGHSEEVINQYLGQIAEQAHQRNFLTIRLSKLVDAYDGDFDLDEKVSDDIFEGLKTSAEKWYRGTGTAEEGARQYLALNMIEKRAVADAYPESIFITYNGRQYSPIFPADLPKFYMYSLKKGTSVKPWFMDEHGRAFEGADGLRGDVKAA